MLDGLGERWSDLILSGLQTDHLHHARLGLAVEVSPSLAKADRLEQRGKAGLHRVKPLNDNRLFSHG